MQKSTDFTNRATNLCVKKSNKDAGSFLMSFYTPWHQIVILPLPVQTIGLFRKYTSLTINILTFITVYVCLSTEKFKYGKKANIWAGEVSEISLVWDNDPAIILSQCYYF